MGATSSVVTLLRNMRINSPQRVDPRSGMIILPNGPFNTPSSLVHSIRRLNCGNAFLRLLGVDTKLYEQVNGSLLASGFSGKPLSMVPFRPDQSPSAWMYIGDANKMVKVACNRTVYGVGIAPPPNPPGVIVGANSFGVNSVLAGPVSFQVIDNFDQTLAWTAGGTASGLIYGQMVDAALNFSAPQGPPVGLGQDSFFTLTPLSSFSSYLSNLLIDIHTSSPTANTLPTPILGDTTALNTFTASSIVYDAGTTGFCFVTVADPSLLLLAGQNVVFSGGITEKVAIISVTYNPGGTTTFRCYTVSNHLAGEVVIQNPSVGVFAEAAFSAALGLTSPTMRVNQLQASFATGTGYITGKESLNLSVTNRQGNRAIQNTDIIYLAVKASDYTKITSLSVLFDVDQIENDFTKNWYQRDFTSVQIGTNNWVVLQIPVVTGVTPATVTSLSITQKARFREPGFDTTVVVPAGTVVVVGNPVTFGGGTAETVTVTAVVPEPTGNIVFTCVTLAAHTTGETITTTATSTGLTRHGTDTTQDLSDVRAIRIQAVVTGNITIAFSSFWIGGNYGGTGVYDYAYIARSSKIGSISNRSPALLNITSTMSGQVILAAIPNDPQIDTLDIYRFGGTLPQWTYIGSIHDAIYNAGVLQYGNFFDVFSDSDIASNPTLSTDNFQPFPQTDVPKSGFVNVSGSLVTYVSGDAFDSRLAPGTEILINGVLYNTYQQPTGSTLTILQNAGTQTNVPYSIPNPELLGVPLPILWGPFEQGTAAFLFGCGSTYQPGILFLTNGNNPDSASDTLQIEVTPPSEPLMNGVMYDGTSFVWSSDRIFRLYPAFGQGLIIQNGQVTPAQGTNLFVPLEIPNGKGLFARWALCVGQKIWFRARDGIYETTGGEPKAITQDDWALLFPQEGGKPGQAIQAGGVIVYPPDDTQTDFQRLSYGDSYVYFDYKDTQGNMRTLVYDTHFGVWSVDDYNPQVLIHYSEEGAGVHSIVLGAIDGNAYLMDGSTDADIVGLPCSMNLPLLSENIGGFQHTRKALIGLLATNATIKLGIGMDNQAPVETDIAVTTAYQKLYTNLPALKGRLQQWYLSSPKPFSVFMRDGEFSIRKWGDPGEWAPINPFGALRKPEEPRIT